MNIIFLSKICPMLDTLDTYVNTGLSPPQIQTNSNFYNNLIKQSSI